MSVGFEHTCALRSYTRHMYCWGINYNPSQTTVPPGVADSAWLAVSAGWYHTCGILLNGTMRCFGHCQGTQVPGSYTWSAVSCVCLHTCGIVAGSGKLLCFGDSSNGKTTVPSALQDERWIQVAAGGTLTCGIL